jgi:hypothetical protein
MSMTVPIFVECPDCGGLRVDARAITVRASEEGDQWAYRFTCPSCQRRAVAATTRLAGLRAVEAGVALEMWRWPAEMGEGHPAGPPLTLVDLLDLRLSLAEPGWLERLSRPTGEPGR